MGCFCTSVIETFSPSVPDWLYLLHLNNICNGEENLSFLIRELDCSYRWSSFLISLSFQSKLYIFLYIVSHKVDFVFLSSSACSSPCLKNKLVGVRERGQIDSLIRCLSHWVIRSPTISGWGNQLVKEQISGGGEKIFLGGYLILEGSIFSVSCFFVEIAGVGCGEEVVFFISHKGKGRCTFPLLKLQCF